MAGLSAAEFYARGMSKGVIGDEQVMDGARATKPSPNHGNKYPASGNVFGVSVAELASMPAALVTELRAALERLESAMASGLPDMSAAATSALVDVHAKIQDWRAQSAIKAALSTPAGSGIGGMVEKFNRNL